MSTLSKNPSWQVTASIRLLLLALVIAFLVVGRELLIPLTISIILTFILKPVSSQLERWHFPKWLAILTSILLAFAVLSAFVWFLYMQVQSFSDDQGQLKSAISEKVNAIQIFIREHFNVSKREQSKWLDKKIAAFIDEGDSFLLAIFSVTGTFLTNLALIPLYIFFMTLYQSRIKKFISLVGNGEEHHVLEILHSISRVAQKYLKGLMIDVSIVAALCSAAFLLLGVKHAVLFGIIVAVCNVIIPYMGVTIASILPLLMMIISNDSVSYSIGVVGACILIQFIDNHFINPYVVGSSVSINPLAAFIGLVASAMMWGIFGMLLCIPVLGMIKVVCDNFTALKPYGYIIGFEERYKADRNISHRDVLPMRRSK